MNCTSLHFGILVKGRVVMNPHRELNHFQCVSEHVVNPLVATKDKNVKSKFKDQIYIKWSTKLVWSAGASILDENLDFDANFNFWRKFRLLTKISIFDEDIEISIFDQWFLWVLQKSVVKKRNLGQKSKFSSKVDIFVKVYGVEPAINRKCGPEVCQGQLHQLKNSNDCRFLNSYGLKWYEARRLKNHLGFQILCRSLESKL